MENQKWLPVVGYEGRYEVSDLGIIKSLKRKGKRFEALLVPMIGKKGYLHVHFKNNNKQKMCRIHRLVAIAFIPNPNNYPQINHINGVKWDNRAENLEWCNNSMNQRHAIDTGLIDIKNRPLPSNTRPVIQLSMNGEFIKEHKSLSQAARELNVNGCGSLCAAVRASKKIYGYKWQYKTAVI